MKYDLDLFKTYKRNSWPFDSLFEDFWVPAAKNIAGDTRITFAPVCEIREDAKNFYISADLPGLKKEDVKVEFREGVLTISGERKVESESTDANVHLRETSYGSFSRSFRLNENLDEGAIQARFQDGVLSLILPKSQEKAAHLIKIQ